MDGCDVLVVGGGPAGSTCAGRLRRAGLDVLVIDQSTFPRDKVCAGWITPQVIAATGLDVEEYRRTRTFQPITGFLTGTIGAPARIATPYGAAVSYGIRRCEFDHYLLARSGARVRLGERVARIRRERDGFVVNDSIEARAIVGAGGHFCPVARWLDPVPDAEALVLAQEAEFRVGRPGDGWAVRPERPELYFRRDLSGYGWCFRKQDYINIGFGRIGRGPLPQATAEFVSFLRELGGIPPGADLRWRGHAYSVSRRPRSVAAAGVLLVGDARGLAYPESGEGIRPAVESGLLAADVLIGADGRYTSDRLARYDAAIRRRFGRAASRWPSNPVLSGLAARLMPWFMNRPSLVRRVLLDRWFLHAHVPALAGA